jgi:hypothetical protein
LETSPPILTRIIDLACGPLAERLERKRLPATMRVHPDVFACIRELRAREMADGYPLMFLGMELAPDPGLAPEGFAFVD